MKVMLTGCFGFIGFNFLRSIQQNFPNDFEIIGIDNLNNKYSKLIQLTIKIKILHLLNLT